MKNYPVWIGLGVRGKVVNPIESKGQKLKN